MFEVMMYCPVCFEEMGEKPPERCPHCAWVFTYPDISWSTYKKRNYKKRLDIARKNWWKKENAHAETASSDYAGAVAIGDRYDSDTPVPELKRDPFDEVSAFEEKINKHPPIPAGAATFIKEEYDILRNIFPFTFVWKNWIKPVSWVAAVGKNHIITKSEEARTLYEKGPTYPVFVRLQAKGGVISVSSIEIRTSRESLIPAMVQDMWRPAGEILMEKWGELEVTFVWIPPGEFNMGSPRDEPERFYNEGMHKVILTKGVYMQTTPVIQVQWRVVMGDNPSRFADNGGNRPVEQVSWLDVTNHFMPELNRLTGHHHRLPTEAEWEYACRAGSTTPFCNGGISGLQCEPIDRNLDQVGWYCGNSAGKTHVVGTKKPNAWGLYDMHGNVWEWCADWFDGYPLGRVVDPVGIPEGRHRVLRGGAWDMGAKCCRSAYRFTAYHDSGAGNIGFRVVRTSL